MATKVLIIDDEAAAAETMAEMCRELDLEPVVVTDPKEALAGFESASPGLVIIDLLLPGTDGLKLGGRLRKAPGGAAVPMLAVSGVFKQTNIARDVWSQLQAEFLPKPLDVKTFQDAVARRLGLQRRTEQQPARRPTPRPQPVAQARPFSSELRTDPAYRIFTRLYEQRASGHLELRRGQARRRLTFHLGFVRHAASNLKQENVGGMQVERGQLDAGDFARAVAHAKEKRVPLSAALQALGLMDARRLDAALKDQVRAVAVGSMGWADGQAQFQPDPKGAAAVPDHRMHPLAAVVEGIRQFYGADALRGFLQGRRSAYLHKTELLDRETFILRNTTPGEKVTVGITGKVTLGELLDRAREEDLPLLFALVATGLARLDRQPQAPGAPAGGSAAGATPPAAAAAKAGAGGPTDADLDAGQSFTPEEQDARRRIAAEHLRTADASHYDVLGVSPGADAAAVQKAYLELARTWHTDRFGGMNLGSAARKLEEVFSRIGEAKSVLSDPDQRGEYDVYLDRKAKGLPTDVGAILKAEEIFQLGERLLKAGKAADALARFQEAIGLNDSEPEFYAWRGYARFRVEGEDGLEAAQADLQRALDANAEMASAHYFRGMIAFSQANLDEAERILRRVVSTRPDHTEAQQQLRVIAMRKEKEKGGMLKKLFGK